jgi:hypothetical protein
MMTFSKHNHIARRGVASERPMLELVVNNDQNGPEKPPTPGAQRFIRRDDRRAIAHAFYGLHRTVRWLKRVNKNLTEREIEDVIREEYREMQRRANITDRLARAA